MITYSILYRAEADRATHYYGEQADDYYSRDAGATAWHGEGARRLGVSGPVDVKQFHAMLRGEFGEGVRAGRSIRKDSRARAGIDLTFSAPKSLTLQALVGTDARLVQAHDAAVTHTLNYIESHLTQARQKDHGKTRVEQTDNLIVATFRHETARPTPNAPPDPNLHTHAVIMNATQRKDGTWVALSNEQIVKLRKLQDAVYMAELDKRVRELGYGVRYEKNHIELAHISREQIDVFSKRSAQVESALAQRGKERESASHAQRQMLTLATRQQKTAELSRNELFQHWVTQAREAGMAFGALPENGAAASTATADSKREPADFVANAALVWAIKHLSERESLMPESDLLAMAVRHASGRISPLDVKKAVQRRLDEGSLLSNAPHYRPAQDRQDTPRTREGWATLLVAEHGRTYGDALETIDNAIREGRLVFDEPTYATRVALEAEQRIVQAERQGRGAVQPVMPSAILQDALQDKGLTAGQREAVELILNHPNQITGIQGMAGTGKSYALQTAKELLQRQGLSMEALAPYGSQVNNLREDGIAAQTVSAFLNARNKRRARHDMGPKTVVVIDEAGVIPVRQMDKLLAQVQATGAKIVTLGDTAQTKAVEAGRAFALLQEQGMKTVVMSDIKRQQSERLRQAVTLAATGRASESLKLLDDVMCIPDAITTDEHGGKTRDGKDRYNAIAQEYTALSALEQGKTLIVTGTNASRQAINERVHELLGLKGQGKMFTLLTRHDTTRAERRCAKYYTVGDIIQPERDYRCGLQRGRLYQVKRCDEHADRISVVPYGKDASQAIDINLRSLSKLSVYREHRAELSPGDWVRITRNSAELDLVNGQRLQVVHVSDTHVTVQTGNRRVDLPAGQPLHLDHAYATTAHSAQGLTCDRVLYNAESHSRTTAQDTYYVSISRERHSVKVFTNDVAKLPEAVATERTKGLAIDLAGRDEVKRGNIDSFFDAIL
ncbi:conjugal transfer protein [Pusillimonas sp. NJUB218]|nr:conjugal transfer protein [Pusillimonas sp. NJUB218]